MKRRRSIFLLTIAIVIAMGITAWAEEKIEEVRLEFSWDRAPKSGDDIGSVQAKADDGQPYEVEYARYITDQDQWVLGDRPVVAVGLTAKSGYRFSYTSKSHFSLSGEGAVLKKARLIDNGVQMELEVYLKRVGGILSDVQNLEWNGDCASWDYLDGARNYDVRLYRDEKLVATVNTRKDYYNFRSHMDREGCYAFRVRAISSYNNRAGAWSDYSEDHYIDQEYARRGPTDGYWRQDPGGWWYAYYGGGYPQSAWRQIDGVWYYFNDQGYMATGWQFIDKDWYLLDASGAMLTGWRFVNGCWYYMSEDGHMLTGWQQINGYDYYLDENGAMYESRWTPDHHYVNEKGIRIQ